MKKQLFVLLLVFFSLGACTDRTKSLDREETPQQFLPRSIDDVNADIVDSPNNPELYIERALLRKGEGKIAEAYDDIDRAIAIDSLRSDFYFEKGKLLYSTSRVGPAKFTLERAIALDANNSSAMLEMAEMLFVMTNHDLSMKWINRALRVDDQLPKAYFLKGLIYKEQDNKVLAKSSFQTVTELDPENIEAFNLLGMVYAAESDSLALAFYNSALDLDSTSKEVLYNKAMYYQDAVRPAEALSTYNTLLRHHPQTAVAYHNKGYIYNGLLSDPSQAVSEFTEAILLNANYPQAHVNRAFALIDLGRIEDAKRDFKKALDLSPNFEPAIKGLNDLQ